MEYRRFGNSELEVSVIGFGGWPMGGSNYGQVDDAESQAAVRHAFDLGITCFDNAAVYGAWLGLGENDLGGLKERGVI